MDQLVLKRAAASGLSGEWSEDDYDVLCQGAVVGRIMKAVAAPVGTPWLWTLAYGHHEDRTPIYGYEPTREAAYQSIRSAAGELTAGLFCRRLPPASRAAQAALSHTGNDGSSTRAKRPREARMREIGHYIGGKKVAGRSGRSGDVFNPNTGEVQAKVSFADKSEVEGAIANAAAAQPAWAATNPQRRARVLFKFLELAQKEFDSLARLLSSEHGKTFADSKGDIQRGLEVVEFACGIPHLLKGEFSDSAGPGIDLFSLRQPLGVVAGITPFNFPAMIPMWKFAPALACGNAFILKPSERDPSVPMRLAELLVEAGLPAGGLNVVNGGKEAVDKVKSYVDLGLKEGAKLRVDGRGLKLQGYESGFFMGGCLFDEVTPDMRIYKEEIFGPVLSVVRAKNYDEALRLPSEHDYGNGVAIFTRDGDTARDFATRVNVGMVGVNFAIPLPLAYYTFGGWKRSGFGDLNQHGPDAVRFYTKTKTVTSRWPSGIKEGAEFVIPTMK